MSPFIIFPYLCIPLTSWVFWAILMRLRATTGSGKQLRQKVTIDMKGGLRLKMARAQRLKMR